MLLLLIKVARMDKKGGYKMNMEQLAIDMEETGKNIMSLRKKAGLKVTDIQDAMNFMSPQAVYKWESGKNLPTIDNCIILSRLLGVKMDDLFVINEAV